MPDRAPLYDPNRPAEVDPADAVVVVHRFLERCAGWATERELPQRLERLRAATDPAEAQRVAASLHAWASWLAFVRHAQAEIESGGLDRWFTRQDGV